MTALLLTALWSFGLILLLFGTAAVCTWLERRLLGLVQERYGPNRAGPFGVLQWVADMIKMLFKEDWVPSFADRPIFILAPALAAAPLLIAFALLPFAPGTTLAPMDASLVLLLALLGLPVYGVVLGGWSSKSKFSLLGGLRAAAQMLSYEVFFGLAAAGAIVQAGSFDPVEIVGAQQAGVWFILPQAVGAALFMIGAVGATHRLPLDLPEAENELTAGYHTEYSGLKFGMFFVGEYLSVLLVCAAFTLLYLGGWDGPVLPGPVWFSLKVLFGFFLFVMMRAALPRPRYDQLMRFAWTIALPLSLLNLLVTAAIVLAAGGG